MMGVVKVLVMVLTGLLVPTACESEQSQARPIQRADWANSSIPGEVCGGNGAVRLHNSYGLVSSSRWPDAWQGNDPAQMPSQVQVAYQETTPARYGDVNGDGQDEAIAPIWCTNGGGTAGGQLGQSLVVFSGTADEPAVMAIITTTQPPGPYHTAYFDNSSTQIDRGRVTVQELWYGPNDSNCCPTGLAEAVWTFNGTTLTLSSSRVTKQPDP